jgi:uncharacterized damage-inducible protein DinB
MSRTLLLDLFDQMEAADAAVWTAALQSVAAAADPALRTYLLHISAVQRSFLDAWKGRPFTIRDRFDDISLAGEFDTTRAYYPEARAFLAAVDEAALTSEIRLPWVPWIEKQFNTTLAATTLGETILQVIIHTAHHRGQANARLRALGVEPPMVDYIAWLWRNRPKPVWAERAESPA